jgi:hypothetical protein
MNKIKFVSFNHVNLEDFLTVVNEKSLRKHLIDHPYFDSISIREWVEDKVKTESLPGCRIRAIYIGDVLAGWCGIQPDDNGFEVAIVIAKEFWGFGIPVFQKMMLWAKEMGHKEIIFHLLETRPEYKSLKRKATKVQKTELLGRRFTTYIISVEKWCVE